MKIVGCDLHAQQQSIAMVDSEAGELTEKRLLHEGNAVQDFYTSLEDPVVAGIEATGAMQWLLELLEEASGCPRPSNGTCEPYCATDTNG